MQLHQSFYAKGKLLITGEYAVLDGALALAIPTKLGQHLEIYSTYHQNLVWRSYDYDQTMWFECIFNSDLMIISSNDANKALVLKNILKQTILQNPRFSKELFGKLVKTKLEFNRLWGFGSSSTLIHLIGQWAEINPYKLLENTFGGSGYDIACAEALGPITFQIINGEPKVRPAEIKTQYFDQFHFIYLGEKQTSQKEITKYSQLKFDREEFSIQVSNITKKLISAQSVSEIISLLETHENILSKTLGYPRVKENRFSSIPGSFKSLGAWGGDFVLYTGDSENLNQIKALGFSTIISWKDMF